ncbi:hypothetical protein [Actinokineospora cianjurensis]|uniref:Uncharacterized protein n=1 Tax=Actinokineospora cianjurensis TaxID=585224 RepID=A0A421AYT6_9PSEU|nr:hypothetical protein [Actinokineospora cianjurensis]RLK55032.1 hypothetical protein CLV68_5424 [Actinokineospora cianjurensis]
MPAWVLAVVVAALGLVAGVLGNWTKPPPWARPWRVWTLFGVVSALLIGFAAYKIYDNWEDRGAPAGPSSSPVPSQEPGSTPSTQPPTSSALVTTTAPLPATRPAPTLPAAPKRDIEVAGTAVTQTVQAPAAAGPTYLDAARSQRFGASHGYLRASGSGTQSRS